MKYQPLAEHLIRQQAEAVPLTFEEIESILGAKLPPSARKHQAWWANDGAHHVNARAWLNAGYRTERVDVGGERLVFRKARGSSRRTAPPAEGGVLERLRARLGGTVTIMPGVDLTAPLDEVWDAEQ